MAAVEFAQSADNDLLEAWLTIAEDNMAAADKMLQTIEHEANTLAQQPKMGRARPELGDAVRSWPTSTPYILYYLPQPDGITVLRALHHARDIHRAWG